jgi:hypothetical protein
MATAATYVPTLADLAAGYRQAAVDWADEADGIRDVEDRQIARELADNWAALATLTEAAAAAMTGVAEELCEAAEQLADLIEGGVCDDTGAAGAA